MHESLVVLDQLAAAHERFRQQRWRAGARGIDWLFSFEAWIEFWVESGKWNLRGRGAGKYVMSRPGDIGPYSRENCVICTFVENIQEAHPKAFREREKRVRLEAKGWTFRGGERFKGRPYQVMVSDRYIGTFATQEEAEAAYRSAKGFA